MHKIRVTPQLIAGPEDVCREPKQKNGAKSIVISYTSRLCLYNAVVVVYSKIACYLYSRLQSYFVMLMLLFL